MVIQDNQKALCTTVTLELCCGSSLQYLSEVEETLIWVSCDTNEILLLTQLKSNSQLLHSFWFAIWQRKNTIVLRKEEIQTTLSAGTSLYHCQLTDIVSLASVKGDSLSIWPVQKREFWFNCNYKHRKPEAMPHGAQESSCVTNQGIWCCLQRSFTIELHAKKALECNNHCNEVSIWKYVS